LSCVGSGSKVVILVGSVIEQVQCDLSDLRLVGRTVHSNNYVDYAVNYIPSSSEQPVSFYTS
jgi:hypothetical protein